MLFVIEARDKPGALEIRLATRPEHMDYLNGLGDTLVLAGPFLDDNEKPCGSLVVIKAESLGDAKAIAARDPYVAAGLFATSEVRRWNWSVNKPEGL
jgi:uncharacterized protein